MGKNCGRIGVKIPSQSGKATQSGKAANDWLVGDAGRDRLHGRGGDGRLEGGPGRDRLYGGATTS